jgi:hypothetical protein
VDYEPRCINLARARQKMMKAGAPRRVGELWAAWASLHSALRSIEAGDLKAALAEVRRALAEAKADLGGHSTRGPLPAQLVGSAGREPAPGEREGTAAVLTTVSRANP